MHDFVFQDKFEYSALIEISRLRERMELELAKEKTKGKNVKLGYGGIADIEFTIQILQLIHGKKNPRLRKTNTIESINMFVAHGMIDQVKADLAKENYIFLRKLECALRIIRQTPTNTLPEETTELAQLASPKAKRLEIRFPDPSCNGYLTFAVMLMAGLDGENNEKRRTTFSDYSR